MCLVKNYQKPTSLFNTVLFQVCIALYAKGTKVTNATLAALIGITTVDFNKMKDPNNRNLQKTFSKDKIQKVADFFMRELPELTLSAEVFCRSTLFFYPPVELAWLLNARARNEYSRLVDIELHLSEKKKRKLLQKLFILRQKQLEIIRLLREGLTERSLTWENALPLINRFWQLDDDQHRLLCRFPGQRPLCEHHFLPGNHCQRFWLEGMSTEFPNLRTDRASEALLESVYSFFIPTMEYSYQVISLLKSDTFAALKLRTLLQQHVEYLAELVARFSEIFVKHPVIVRIPPEDHPPTQTHPAEPA